MEVKHQVAPSSSDVDLVDQGATSPISIEDLQGCVGGVKLYAVTEADNYRTYRIIGGQVGLPRSTSHQ